MAVNLSNLKLLIQSPDLDDADVQLFADQGDLIVTEYLASSGLSTAIKEQIALLMAAHFAVTSREFGGLKQVRIGESEEQYKSVATDKVGFLSTRFGQQACALDTTGTLTSMSSQWSSKAVIETIRPAC